MPMNRKKAPRIMLTLLLIGMLTLVSNIQAVRASQTIYIRADGSVDPPETPISSLDDVTYTFTDNIYDEIVIERNDIILDGNGHTLQSPGSGTGIYLLDRSNVTIKNTEIKLFDYGIMLALSCNSSIAGNNITANSNGVWLEESFNNTVSGNNINNCIVGVVICCASSNNTVSGNNITKNDWGVNVVGENIVSSNNITNNRYSGVECHSFKGAISGNNITNNTYYYGIHFYSSSNGIIFGNNITNNNYGVYFYSSFNNTVLGNNITKNDYGVYLVLSSNNRFYHNNIIDNTLQVCVTTSGYTNFWDESYPSGGNYWSDYNGTDVFSGSYQNETGSDGIGDTPYVIPVFNANNADNYPLMKPYGGPYDIGIMNITISKTVVGQGYNLNITVKILNYGINAETFNVTVYANTTIINQTQITLTSRNSTTINFTWKTTGIPKGNYTISAYTAPVPGETNTANNVLINSWVVVTIAGDINGDYKVDHKDLLWLASAYGSEVGDPNYNPEADLNNDGKIDHKDLLILAANYGKGN
jgi:parallel beta-helix repeat protein